MKSFWKWSIASACILVALILIAGVWLAANRDVTTYGGLPPPSLSRDEVDHKQGEPKPTAREDAAITTVLRPQPPPRPTAPTIIAAAPAAATPPPPPPEPDRMVALHDAIQALPKGNIVLHAPDAMRVAERRNVEAGVGVNVPMEILRKQVDSRDKAVEGTLRVSSEMVATLTDQDLRSRPSRRNNRRSPKAFQPYGAGTSKPSKRVSRSWKLRSMPLYLMGLRRPGYV